MRWNRFEEGLSYDQKNMSMAPLGLSFYVNIVWQINGLSGKSEAHFLPIYLIGVKLDFYYSIPVNLRFNYIIGFKT